MTHPYQLACVCSAPHFGAEGLLLAACGPKIISINLQNGSIVSQWPEQCKESSNDMKTVPEQEGPPGKKRKLEKPEPALPSVIKLVLSPDQSHAVAVTSEDKCIRVFEIAHDGTLIELSQRCMPKRPCAILVTPDNQTILCGDKFGDVYSLPLLHKDRDEAGGSPAPPSIPEGGLAKAYVPTASNLTVHTGRNRRALENQLKQKDLQAKSKEPLKFEHQLLLGHVSMLTDVQHATYKVDGRARNVIITSDRDEHIRISRAAPQAHVIERYCLGHKEFISKLCLLPESNMLISGGGDDWLGVWDWTSGELLEACDIRTAVKPFLQRSNDGSGGEEGGHVAISGLWAVPGAENGQTMLLAASERTPAIIVIRASTLGSGHSKVKAIELPGNPLDVMFSGSTLVISLDPKKETTTRLVAYKLQAGGDELELVADAHFNRQLQSANEFVGAGPPSADSLYGIENMRKRGNEEGQEAV